MNAPARLPLADILEGLTAAARHSTDAEREATCRGHSNVAAKHRHNASRYTRARDAVLACGSAVKVAAELRAAVDRIANMPAGSQGAYRKFSEAQQIALEASNAAGRP